MKHLYKLFCGAMMLATCGMNATAQQLPNVGFDSEWVACTPWNSKNNTNTEGSQPVDWTVSNVIGTGTLGKTTIASQVSGYNSSKYAVELKNTPNPLKKTEIVPGYISLGTTWATSKGMFTITNKDGGTFGGINFTYTPDAVSFYYKRSHGTANASEPATVVAYLWKGTWSQASVPGNNATTESPTTVTMVDRERNILGMSTIEGGAVTKTDDAELIASLNYSISGDAADWTRFIQPLDYKTASTPAKFNIIIAANDYFNSANIGDANSITVDNVQVIYYSRLSALSVNGVAVEGFASETYNYTMTGTTLPTEDQIAATVMGRSATKSVAIDADAATVTITVANSDVDVDGAKSHSYVLQYEKAPAKEGVATDYPGYLNIKMPDNGEIVSVADNDPATVTITDYNDGTCDFLLPNLTLATLGLELGDIKVENATITKNADGLETYNGVVEKMLLLEGAIVADVTLNGTITAAGIADMQIDVIWIQDESDRTLDVPINVTFTTDKQSGVASIVVDGENASVDVYTITGIKVMSNVVPAQAVKSLDKGFYIMGGKKVVIR